jgi:signal transduction histidine kinase
MDDSPEKVPPEVVGLRLMGLLTLGAFIFFAFVTEPRAGVTTGRGLAILLLTVVWVGSTIRVLPMQHASMRARLSLLVVSAVAAVALYGLQPKGFWVAAPYVVAAIGAIRLPGKASAILFGADLVALLVVGIAADHAGQVGGIVSGVIPFYFFMRLMVRTRQAHEVTKGLVRDLEASRAAEADAAAENERARVAREMHDVLAHSLSALALQLESTRLLAEQRDVDPDVVAAVERAHGLAASGLEEARRAISALRGDELPSLSALVEAFRESTGISCALAESGTPAGLPAEARLTVYRTAQEALTNVRKHAADAERVEVSVSYRDDGLCLVVADHGARVPVGAPTSDTALAGGYGLTGMRERAELLGGTLTAAPAGDGFRVELVLPAS